MAQVTATPLGITRHRLDDVGSTNSHALDLARDGHLGPLWVTANRQLTGRGRHGRTWVSEPGNLYASLMLTDPAPVAKLSELPLVAAVALAHAVEDAGKLREMVQLKWPNDLLVSGRKISGILLESAQIGRGSVAVVLGFGVNIRHHPAKADYPTTSLSELNGTTDVDSVFTALESALMQWIGAWARGTNFTEIRQQWLARAAGLGTPVRVRLSDRVIEGRFRDLDDEGRFVLTGRDGKRITISAGDVFFPDTVPGGAGGRKN